MTAKQELSRSTAQQHGPKSAGSQQSGKSASDPKPARSPELSDRDRLIDHNVLVLSEDEAARVLKLSRRTLQQSRIDGTGPEYLQITKRRIGYTMEGLERWLETKVRRSTCDAAAGSS